jgi:hypothetical protein
VEGSELAADRRPWRAVQRSLRKRQRPRKGRAELIVLLVALAAALSTASWIGSRVDVELSSLFDLPAGLGFAYGSSAPHPVVGFKLAIPGIVSRPGRQFDKADGSR